MKAIAKQSITIEALTDEQKQLLDTVRDSESWQDWSRQHGLAKVQIMDKAHWQFWVEQFLMNGVSEKRLRQHWKPGTESDTLNTYRKALSTTKSRSGSAPKLYQFLTAQGVTNPGRRDLEKYITALQAHGLATRSINLYIIVAKSFFGFLDNQKAFGNKAHQVKTIPIKQDNKAKTKRGYIREDWLTALVARLEIPAKLPGKVDIRLLTALRDRALLYTMFYAGIRRTALVRLRKADFKLIGDRWQFDALEKGRTERGRKLCNKPTAIAVNQYLTALKAFIKVNAPDLLPEIEKPNFPLFVSLDKNPNSRFKALSRTAISDFAKRKIRQLLKSGIITGDQYSNLCAHSFRHGFAMRLYKSLGYPESKIQRLLGHKQLSTTVVYLKGLQDDEILDDIAADPAFDEIQGILPEQTAAPGRPQIDIPFTEIRANA